MLIELMDGRALTANELARAAHVLAPTASRHLAMLVDAGLLVVEQHGRHRYHRLASAAVARVIESIMALAVRGRPAARTAVATGPRDLAMRRVRQCYDHLAGRLGVAIAERLQADGSVVIDGEHARVGNVAESARDRRVRQPRLARRLEAASVPAGAAPLAGQRSVGEGGLTRVLATAQRVSTSGCEPPRPAAAALPCPPPTRHAPPGSAGSADDRSGRPAC